jgi:thiol-disulfide isomerase/thioredoxin
VIIFDFFATHCVPCLKSLPEFEQLQKRFKDKIQIIVVSSEPLEKVKSFLKKRNLLSSTSLPFLGSDTILQKMFPHIGVPHEVWVDKNGVVRAITDQQYVNEQNITDMLSGVEINWTVKNDEVEFDRTKTTLFSASTTEMNGLIFYSGFTPYVSGAKKGEYYLTDSTNSVKRYNQYNQSLLVLYTTAFNTPAPSTFFNNPKRCVFEVKDLSRFIYNDNAEYRNDWQHKNWYCYEAVHPITVTDNQLKAKLKQDLDFYFNLDCRLEKRTIPCLILRQINSDTSLTLTKYTLPLSKLVFNKTYSYTQYNETISSFVRKLNTDKELSVLPLIINETKLFRSFDMELDLGTDVNNISAWKSALNGYGLDIMLEERELSMLVIIDKN